MTLALNTPPPAARRADRRAGALTALASRSEPSGSEVPPTPTTSGAVSDVRVRGGTSWARQFDEPPAAAL